MIAPANPGGGWDQTARAMQTVLQDEGLVSRVQVQNVPGAGGAIGLARFVTTEAGKGDALLGAGQTLQVRSSPTSRQSPSTRSRRSPGPSASSR